MEPLRKPYQGIWNIIRFNWHFYLLATAMVVCMGLLNGFLAGPYHLIFCIIIGAVVITTFISLVVSFYVYDLSGLYQLNWLNELEVPADSKIVNINAGFDELSTLLQHKFPDAGLLVYDFYDPLKHTEVSIKRARMAYPPYKNTVQISTSNLPLPDNYADNIFVLLAAHEIRNDEERDIFFIELHRILKDTGKIIVVEHLRDTLNFLAYNVGFLHFTAKPAWYKAFKNAGLNIYKEQKITLFITSFTLEKKWK